MATGAHPYLVSAAPVGRAEDRSKNHPHLHAIRATPTATGAHTCRPWGGPGSRQLKDGRNNHTYLPPVQGGRLQEHIPASCWLCQVGGRRPVPRTIPTYLASVQNPRLQEHVPAASGAGQVVGSRRMVATPISTCHPYKEGGYRSTYLPRMRRIELAGG